MIVTDIKDYKKGRYEIYLNDEMAFILYKSEIKSYNIKVGQELSGDIISEITDVVLTKRAKKRAMNLLMKNDMTEMKLRGKLIDGGYSKDVADAAIKYVKGYHYIDDRRYAMSFINAKSSTDSKSSIKRKLIEKGISKELADSCIEEFYVDDELNINAERELIKKLAEKKIRQIGNGNSLDYESKQKVLAFLMRKGFSYYDVDAVLNDLL